MRCFVSVLLTDHHRTADPGMDLVLLLRSSGRDYGLLARVGGDGPGTDEHLAVDAEACAEPWWSACADVLYGRHPRPLAVAARWLSALMAAHPGCRVGAVPLADGGWAVTDRSGLLLLRGVPADRPLLVSCLHGWLTAGRRLRDIEDVRVAGGGG
ncbi:hypothetical protein RKD23_001387 [Streptomyces sp. SAI-170]|uniref:hypothetical protein n=1 Tax=Streptomyces sp. SAI-170 TaxID=3377729 RepID=UPI003C7D6CC0